MSDEKVEDAMKHADIGPDEDGDPGAYAWSLSAVALAAEVRRLRAIVDGRFAIANLMNADPHKWSTRGCGTCQTATDLIGQPYGCVKYKAEQAKDGAK